MHNKVMVMLPVWDTLKNDRLLIFYVPQEVIFMFGTTSSQVELIGKYPFCN
jgi:hypothetical protein